MPPRPITGKKPKNLGYTVKTLLSYMGRHKFLLLAVAVLVTISALANLTGTYMIRPVVNRLAEGGTRELAESVAFTAAVYATGALCALGYTQTMVKAAQRVLYDIRRDLFAHLQTLPLRFFDSRRHGDVMSYFTNDVDTIADALNNSFAMVIQSFIQMTGTLILLFVLNWRLSLVAAVCYVAMFLYIRFSARRSKACYQRQQASLGDLDGYIEEMVEGQKVVKGFTHEEASLELFREKNEALRKAGTGAQGYAATMIPAVVSISYLNYAVVAVLGGIMAMKGMTDVGSLASYLVFVRQAAAPINQFTQQSNFLLAALAGAERVFQVMDQSSEVDDGKVELVNVEERDGRLIPCGEKKTGCWAWRKEDGTLVPLRGDVRFLNVDFGYEPGHPILRDISLCAKPPSPISSIASTMWREGVWSMMALTSGRSRRTPSATPWGWCSRIPTSSQEPLQTTSVSASWMPPRRRWRRRPGSPTRIPSSAVCLMGTILWLLPTVPTSPRANGSCWPSHGQLWRIPRC